MKHTIYLAAAVLLACVVTGCKKDNPDSHDFTNKVFVEDASKPTVTLLKKGAAMEFTKTIRAAVADPAAKTIELTFAAAPELVETYNARFYDQAIVLPEANYELPELKAELLKGSIVSSEVAVNFRDLDQLDREQAYVLPVTLVSATNIEVLERSRTTYYVFRGSSLINVVGSLAGNDHLDVTWKNANVVRAMQQLTIEALVWAKFDRAMSTVLGIEGNFLLRLGDVGSGLSSNQIQLATGDGNLPKGKDVGLEIPEGEWVHVAVTYEYTLGEGNAKIYINGVEKAAGKVYDAPVTLGITKALSAESESSRGFHIGVAYDPERSLNGNLSEVRIWNRVLTATEINEPDHFYYADPKSEGLVCYWKFDEGEGLVVNDRTGNGNHAQVVLKKGFSWTSVELPAPSK